MVETVKMVFVGGKGAPANGHPYNKGQTYDLPPRYARFSWFKLVDAKGAVIPEKKAEVKPKPEGPGKTNAFDNAFQEELASQGLTGPEIGAPVTEDPDASQETAPEEIPGESTPEPVEAPVEALEVVEDAIPEKLTRSKLERMNKGELVEYITKKGGIADESLMKSVLVETAVNLE